MTSYVMCNKKKLGIRKSDNELLKKSVEDRKLEYFKSELLKILDKKEKEENGEEVSKSFIVQELYKSMTDPLYMAKGGKVGVVGEIRTWNGKKYKKMPNKKWVRVYDTHDRHTEISIARLKGKVRNAQSVDELFEIVMNNTHRFSDENGKPLDIVLELKKEVDAKKKALNAGKPSTKEQIKKEQKEENKTTNAYGFTEQEVKDLNYLFNQFSNHSTRKLNWKAFNEQLNLSTRAGSKILHKITKKLCKDNDLTLSERASLPANAIHDAIDNLFMNYIEPKKKTITLPKVKEWIGKVQAAYDKLRSGKFYKEHLKREERTIDSDLPEEELKQRYKNQRKDLIEWLLKGDESYAMTITPYVEKYGKALGISKKDRETITDDDYNFMYHIGNGGGKGGDEPPKNDVNKKIKIDIKDFPEQFNKGKWKKQTKILMDFMNGTSGDSTVKSLYKKLGAMINNLPFKIAKPKRFSNGQFTVSCDRKTMKPLEQTLHLLDISDENENIRRDTCTKALHEIMHMIDFSCRDNKSSPDYLSNSDEEIVNAINNAKISDEEISELEEHFKDFRAQERKIIESLNEKASKIEELGRQYQSNEITTYEEYGKKYREIQSQWESERKKITELRAKNVEVSQYADILDALSGGNLHDDKGFGGHGKEYYRKESNKVNEIVANYAALLAIGSEYADRLKKKHPELAESVYNLYKKMLER